MQQTSVHTIVFHENAERHIDDAACLWAIRNLPEAEARFPGISTAEIVFAGTGGESYQGSSGDEFEKEGVLMFGVGAGRFDEHPSSDNPNGKKKCSFALFCDEIGVADNRALAITIKYVAESDRGNSGPHFCLGSLAKIMYNVWPNDPMRIFQWQMDAISAVYTEQQNFFKAEDEYDSNAQEKWVEGPSGHQILVASIVSGNALMNNCARSKGVAVLVQKRPANCDLMPGNVAIFTDRKARLCLSEVVSALRQEEQRITGVPVTTDHQKLRTAGKMEGIPWYYMTGNGGEAILNGSFSAPKTPASKIPLNTIVEITIANLQ